MHNFNPAQLVLMIVPLLFAVTIHEVAHGYAAYRMGDDTARRAGRLTLNPIKHLDPFGSIILPLLLKLSGSPILFGYAKPVPVNFNNLRDFKKGTILVASAGVTANLACAVVSGLLFQVVDHLDAFRQIAVLRHSVDAVAYMLFYSVIINLVLMIFNLIPVPPLDGSRIVGMLLPPQLQASYEKIERYGMIIIILLLLTGFLGKVVAFVVNPLMRLLIGM
jgi:Zn-dependent protease